MKLGKFKVRKDFNLVFSTIQEDKKQVKTIKFVENDSIALKKEGKELVATNGAISEAIPSFLVPTLFANITIVAESDDEWEEEDYEDFEDEDEEEEYEDEEEEFEESKISGDAKKLVEELLSNPNIPVRDIVKSFRKGE